VRFVYDTGLGRRVFSNVRLCGSWSADGRRSEREWTTAGSRRTLAAALALPSGAPAPTPEMRPIAEARCRFAAGMSMLSAGTPLFLMGEEIGAVNDFRFDDFLANREDLHGGRARKGRKLFAFYQDIIRLRLRERAFTSLNIEVVLTHNDDRLIAFRRWKGREEYLVVGTLTDRGFPRGRLLEGAALMEGSFVEIFNSDLPKYGGDGVSNADTPLASAGGRIRCGCRPAGSWCFAACPADRPRVVVRGGLAARGRAGPAPEARCASAGRAPGGAAAVRTDARRRGEAAGVAATAGTAGPVPTTDGHGRTGTRSTRNRHTRSPGARSPATTGYPTKGARRRRPRRPPRANPAPPRGARTASARPPAGRRRPRSTAARNEAPAPDASCPQAGDKTGPSPAVRRG
jgi:hypothetical protein